MVLEPLALIDAKTVTLDSRMMVVDFNVFRIIKPVHLALKTMED